MGFPRPEYWSGLRIPPPEDLPDPGIKRVSPALAGGFFTTEPPGKPLLECTYRRTCTSRNQWGNSGNSGRLYFFGSKITADGDCSHEIKRRLLLGRKVMTNLDSILKSRDITLPTKVHLVKVMVFPVVMYGCES